MDIRLACLAITSIVALGVAGCGSSDSSSGDSPDTSAAAPAAIDAKALFVDGKGSSGALSCGSCHALKAAGTGGSVGPDLDAIAPDDDAAALAEMISDPNAEIVEGYAKGVMPADYGSKLTAEEITAIAAYIDQNSAHSGD